MEGGGRVGLASLLCSFKNCHKISLLQDVINSGSSASAEHFVDLLLPVLLDHLQMPEQIADELLVKKCERMAKAINVLTNILFVCLLAGNVFLHHNVL